MEYASGTWDMLQSWILEDPREPEHLTGAIGTTDSLDSMERGYRRLAQRVAKGIHSFENEEASALDLAVLLRQAIRSFGRRLWLPSPLWKPISELDHRAGLIMTAQEEDRVKIAAKTWNPNWLPQTETIEEFRVRRLDRPSPGSGTLKKAYGFSTFQSEAQKAAVDTCEFTAPGSTTLITLPTGGGKSLCTILPAWRRSLGGTRRGGTTIVVVPTVALAIDQYRSALEYFPATIGPDFEPQLWTGQTTPEVREQIREGIESGTTPLVFTSPESLLQSSMRSAVNNAALRGNLSSVVIDEAHIVATWGAQFRVDFQLLASFLKRLHRSTGGELRTILLSATIDHSSEDILAHLFSYGPITIVRANAVRPEPSWWFDWADSEDVRSAHVIEALAHLPRPAILYVNTREDARRWLTTLHEAGYLRVASFTGDTGDRDRDALLRRWREDDIDVMVATSAFGLGVDKPDVRTVLHACLPESIDRYYQEVGRGGRDGLSCVSLVCAIPEDTDISFSLTKASRISTDKAVDRWRGMRRQARTHDTDPSILTLNIDAPPLYDLDMQPGDRHRDWNMHTLLLLQRAGLLEIEDNPVRVDQETAESDAKLHFVDVRIKASRELQGNADTLWQVLDPFRRNEREHVQHQLQGVVDLVTHRSGLTPDPTECVSSVFARLYPDCARRCGGCPECRRIGRAPYSEPLDFFVEYLDDPVPQFHSSVHGELSELLGSRSRLTVLKPDRIGQLPQVLGAIVREGISQIIVAERYLQDYSWIEQVAREFADSAGLLHVVVPESWVQRRHDIRLHGVPTAILYPDDDDGADLLHRAFSRKWSGMPASIPIVNVIRDGTYLQSESGRFIDRVPGIVIPAEALVEELQAATEGWF